MESTFFIAALEDAAEAPRLRETVSNMEGVQRVDVDAENGELHIQVRRKVDRRVLERVLATEGYELVGDAGSGVYTREEFFEWVKNRLGWSE